MIPVDVQSAVTQFFKNPAIAKAVTENVLKKKPSSWGKMSNAPYFNAFYANDIKPFIDEVIVSRKDLIFLFSKYPRISPKTVYLRINQSLLFLCECMNDDFKYSNFKNMTDCTIEPKIGIRYSYKPQFQEGEDNSKPMIVEPQSRGFIWREAIDVFLNDPSKTEFFMDKLLLTPQQVIDTKASMPLEGVIHSITVHTVRIIKVN